MKRHKTGQVDLIMVGIVLALILFGLAMLYSASTVLSYSKFGNTSHFFFHQLIYGAAIGMIAMVVCSYVDYRIWKKLIPIALIASLICLVLIKVPGLGFSAGGATRWLSIGPIFFQPAEIAKFAVVIYLAGWLSKPKAGSGFVNELLPPFAIIGLFAFLILLQPDLGTILSMISTSFIMLFAGGVRIKYLAWSFIAGILSLLVLIKLEPYRLRRITTFLDPSVDPLGIGYQINQALLAIGGGGLWGYGYGFSKQKYNYLPEVMGDSIFAVIAEELGFLRVTGLLAIFAIFALRGIHIARKISDQFGKMLAIGITTAISIQAIINIGAIIGLLPLTGITLPFFSYGSTSFIITMVEIGILLNISRHTN